MNSRCLVRRAVKLMHFVYIVDNPPRSGDLAFMHVGTYSRALTLSYADVPNFFFSFFPFFLHIFTHWKLSQRICIFELYFTVNIGYFIFTVNNYFIIV